MPLGCPRPAGDGGIPCNSKTYGPLSPATSLQSTPRYAASWQATSRSSTRSGTTSSAAAASACAPSSSCSPPGRPAPGTQAHIPAAALIEFIHTATLLHDDVVDDSARRRGRETANHAFGNPASVLVGDFLYSRAFQMMATLDSAAVIRVMADATNTIAAGEVLQLMNSGDPDTTEIRYMEVIYRKTARLFEAGAQIAAIVARAPAGVEAALARYGKHLGIAFQLVDDALDYRGDDDELGKDVGDDLAEGKPTLPLIHALAHSDAESASLIRNAIEAGGIEEQGPIRAVVESTGGLDYTARLAEEEAKRAEDALADVPASAYRDALAALARYAVSRRS